MGEIWTCPECGAEYDKEERTSAYHQHKYNRHSLDDGEEYIERYRRIKSEIPEKYHDAYDKITGSGSGPRTVQAAVCYIESSATQDEVAEIFDSSDYGIRQMVRRLIDNGAVTVEEVRENCADNGYQVFGEKRCVGEESPEVDG